MEKLIHKIKIHLETTDECVENTNLPDYVIELLKQDSELLKEVLTALSGVGEEGIIPFEKAVDRASLNSFDRIEFIKGAKWAHEFISNPKNPE